MSPTFFLSAVLIFFTSSPSPYPLRFSVPYPSPRRLHCLHWWVLTSFVILYRLLALFSASPFSNSYWLCLHILRVLLYLRGEISPVDLSTQTHALFCLVQNADWIWQKLLGFRKKKTLLYLAYFACFFFPVFTPYSFLYIFHFHTLFFFTHLSFAHPISLYIFHFAHLFLFFIHLSFAYPFFIHLLFEHLILLYIFHLHTLYCFYTFYICALLYFFLYVSFAHPIFFKHLSFAHPFFKIHLSSPHPIFLTSFFSTPFFFFKCIFHLNPSGIMFKALDCGIVGREFEPQSRYYVHFQTNTLGKVWSPLSSQL